MDASFPMWAVFLGAAITETPLLAVAIAGIILASTKLSRAHGSALFWSIAGFALIATRSVVNPLGITRMAMSRASGLKPQQMVVESTFWSLGAQFLLLAALACLLIATLSNRKPG